MNETDKVLDYVEEMFQKYGAEPIEDGSEKLSDGFGLRRIFVRNNLYYRAEIASFEEGCVVIISATDDRKFATVGIQDNIAGFSADYPPEKIEKEVRFAFGIEPYPETYPIYE